MSLPIFIDIDGTLTTTPDDAGGAVHLDRVAKIRDLIAQGTEIVIWSARGGDYAIDFCAVHGIEAMAIGKPSLCVDDKPTIRAAGLAVVAPEAFFS